MAWGGVSTNDPYKIHIFQGGSATAGLYVEEVLQPQFRGVVDHRIIYWMTSHPHRVYVVAECFQTDNIIRIN